MQSVLPKAPGGKPKRQGWIDGGIGYIPLSNGQLALVDPDMVAPLTQFNWYPLDSVDKRRVYAYAYVARYQPKMAMHRVVLGLASDDPRDGDHINGNTLDNRRTNLRPASRSANNTNVRGPRADNSCGYRGVTLHTQTGRWSAEFAYQGRRWRKSGFPTPEVAAHMYDAFVAAYGPPGAYRNFPE